MIVRDNFLIAIWTLPKIEHFQLQASLKEQHLRKTQSHQASIKLHKAIRMQTLLVKPRILPEKIKMKSFRQEIVQQVKVRVEELQLRMKSESDMFYVMRHMCKKYLWINLLRWLSSPRVRWLTNPVHEGYLDRNKNGMLSILI